MDEYGLYIGAKIIKAKPMTNHTFHSRFKPHYKIPQNQEDQPGYWVEYPDGYQSWSPEEVFETAYRIVTPGEILLLKHL